MTDEPKVAPKAPRTIWRIENYAATKAAFYDRMGVNDTGLDRHERADRRRTAAVAWKAAVAEVKKAHRASQEKTQP